MFKKMGLRAQLMVIFGGVFALAIVVMTVVMALVLGNRAASLQEQALENNLYGLGYYMAYSVFGEEVTGLADSGDFSDPTYALMLEELSFAWEIDPNIQRVYTVVPDASVETGLRVVTLHTYTQDAEGYSVDSRLIEEAAGDPYTAIDPDTNLSWLADALNADPDDDVVFYAPALAYDTEQNVDYLTAAATLANEDGSIVALVIMESYADSVFAASDEVLLVNGIAAIVIIPVLLGVVAFVSERISAPLRTLEEAVLTLEDAERDYDPGLVEPLKARTDEVGKLSRMFDEMAKEVEQREKRLKMQVQQLKIEIDAAKRQEEVESITSSEFFQDLKSKVKDMREEQDDEGDT